MTKPDDDSVRDQVRQTYARVAERTGSGGGGCCGPVSIDATRLGYSAEDRDGSPAGADLGLGCGNPQAIAELRAGETVLDLGAGAGFDCFLAARQVGPGGRVIGVDMTPAMLARARANARREGFENVEMRLGEIEALPVADNSVDVIMSNCVINLSPDKPRVFQECVRVLKPGGRLAISDIVATAPLPDALRDDPDLLSGCVAGAATVEEIERWLATAGFDDVRVDLKPESRELVRDWFPGRGVEDYVCSATIVAFKPDTKVSSPSNERGVQ